LPWDTLSDQDGVSLIKKKFFMTKSHQKKLLTNSPAVQICTLVIILYSLLIPAGMPAYSGPVPDGRDTVKALPADTAKEVKKTSKFDKFNKKVEKLFIYIPVPMYSYSSEAGHIFGLAKFNIINLYKDDNITKPSKISEVLSFSTKGRINASIAAELLLRNNKYMILSSFNYKKTPEYIFGIGNDVKKEDVEQITTDHFKFVGLCLRKLGKKDFYAGAGLAVSDYFSVKTDSNSFLVTDNVTGLNGGTEVGVMLAAAWEGRENRYNPIRGHYIQATYTYNPKFLGSAYQFSSFELDLRKYFNPWLNHVIALQATTMFTTGNVPFYEMAMLGGDYKMRGYYKGALRDKVLVDCQLEYRMPVWNIFGVTGWIGTGRVAPDYGSLSFSGFWLDYGFGLRLMVDSAHRTNLRFDFGFGPHGVNGFYINFAEAF
jgi:hypothetical protein